MAEKLCELKKKGGVSGNYTETSLWTNPSPSVDFAAQTITLSDSLSNYKYIAIRYCYNKSYPSITNKVIYLVDDFKTATQSTSTNHTVGGLSVQGSDNKLYTRNIFYVSDTSVSVSLSQLENGSGTYAAGAIPLEILGLNELDHKGMISGLLTPVVVTNNTSASTWYVNTTGIPKYAIVSSARRDNGKNSVFMLDFENEMSFGYNAYNGSYSQQTSTFSQIVSNITSAGFTVAATSGSSCHNMVFLYY